MLLASFQTDIPHFFSTQGLVLCHIESTKAGTLIGKEGANIKKIAQECGMHHISVLSTEITDGKCAVVAETYSTDERVAQTANRFIESILIANGNITAIPFHVNEMDMFKMGSIRKMMLLTRQLHILGYPVYMISHIHAIGSFRFAVRYVDEPDIDMFRSPYEEPCIIRYSGPGHYDILKGVETVEECIVSSPRKLASMLAVLKGLVRKPFGSRMTSHARWFALICLSSVQFCDKGFSERFDTHRSKLAEENSELDFSNTLTSGIDAIRKPFILDECEGRVRHKLADAAKAGQWKTVMQILDIYPSFVNATRPGGKAGYTVLHQAAKLRAHRLVFDYLIAIPDCDIGQQTAEGKNAYQIAMESPVPDPYVIAKLGRKDLHQKP